MSFIRLGFGAVDGIFDDDDCESREAASDDCGWDGGSCRTCREVENSRLDGVSLAPQLFRRAGKCE